MSTAVFAIGVALGTFLHASASPSTSQHPEIIREVRVHGNAFLSDGDVLRLAGVAVGEPLGADALKAIAQRLKDSGRFETIEVRKRHRSIADPTDIAIVLVVHERPGVRSATDEISAVARPWRRFRSRLMFLPILSFADGYGLTYGARFSTVGLLGAGERLSVPLTWGGTRRAALEFERSFERGPLTRVESTFGIWQRENPHFRLADRRVELKARAEKTFADLVRVGVDAGRSTVAFDAFDDRLWTFGSSVALDTRADPAFPRHAVLLGAGWSSLNVRRLPRINRYTTEARGYVGLIGQSVFAARIHYARADAPLPPYEKLLLGGSGSLRGFRAGTFIGDRTLITSAEVRVPITSVLSGAKLGVSAFLDAGKAVDFGHRFDEVQWQRGAGAGVYLIASIVRINVDVARGLDGGKTRVHVSSGFTF